MGQKARRLRSLKKDLFRRQQAEDRRLSTPMHMRALHEVQAIEDAHTLHYLAEYLRGEELWEANRPTAWDWVDRPML
jgi:hypothetical protein